MVKIEKLTNDAVVTLDERSISLYQLITSDEFKRLKVQHGEVTVSIDENEIVVISAPVAAVVEPELPLVEPKEASVATPEVQQKIVPKVNTTTKVAKTK